MADTVRNRQTFMTTDELIAQLWTMGRTAQCIERHLLMQYGRVVSGAEIWKVIGQVALEQSRQRHAEILNGLVKQ